MYKLNLTVNAADENNAPNAEGRYSHLEGVLPADAIALGAGGGRTVELFTDDAEAVGRINEQLASAGSELEWLPA